MPEWWTYRPSDFLMFEPETYYRLFELYNRHVWPAQVVAVLLGLMLVALAWQSRQSSVWPGRVAAAILMLAWLWVAWAFHWRRYATINLAAGYVAAAYAIQAVLLSPALRRPILFRPAPHKPDPIGIGVALFGLLFQPLLGPLQGRGWAQIELFGLAPDPTVTATLGILLAGAGSWVLFVIPLLWCVATGATLWAMGAADAWVMPALGLLVVGRAVWRK